MSETSDLGPISRQSYTERPAKPAAFSPILEDAETLATSPLRPDPKAADLRDGSPKTPLRKGSGKDNERRIASDPPGRFASIKSKLGRPKSGGDFLLSHTAPRPAKSKRPLSALVGLSKRDGIRDQSSQSVARADHTSDSPAPSSSPRAEEIRSTLSPAGSVSVTQDHEDVTNAPGTATAHDSQRRIPSSAHSSPMSSSMASSGMGTYRVPDRFSRPPSSEVQKPDSPAIDPAQIVRMALNLSESRRMHLEPGHLVSMPASDRRVVSAATPIGGYSMAQSLGESSQTKRPSSQNGSPGLRLSTHSNRNTSTSSPRSSAYEAALETREQFQLDSTYDFSPATIMRAEKAKSAIELNHQYRRLLERLPPLEPNSRPNDDAQEHLGRQYNPLQYIRNRKVRAREKANIDAEADGWHDLGRVVHWVDAVGEEAQQPGYIVDDVAMLPDWFNSSRTPEQEANVLSKAPDGSRTKPKHQRLDWLFDPADLLADAQWLEQLDHKALIQSKDGHKIFPRLRRPTVSRRERASTGASHKSRKSFANDDHSSPISPQMAKSPISASTTESDQDANIDDIAFKPARQSRATRVKNQLLKRSRAHTVTSDEPSGSDSDSSRKQDRLPGRRHRPNANIGPLERHMKNMLEKESNETAKDALDTSPPQHKGEGRRRLGVSNETYRDEQVVTGGDRGSRANHDFSLPESPEEASPTTPRISIEDFDEERKSRDMATSYQPGKTSLEVARPGRHSTEHTRPHEATRVIDRATNLGFLRRRGTSINQVSAVDFAPDASSTKHTDVKSDQGISNTSDDTRNDTARSAQEGSGSRRLSSPASKKFFKGGRIGEIVRNEGAQASDIVFKRQPPRQDSTSSRGKQDMSTDSEDIGPTDVRKPRPLNARGRPLAAPSHHRRSSSANDTKRLSTDQYHIKNLPSFVSSSAARQGSLSQTSDGDDHISRQSRERRHERKSSRLNNERAVPILDMSDISPNTSSQDLTRTNTLEDGTPLDRQKSYGFPVDQDALSRSSSSVRTSQRLNAILGSPGTVGKGGLPKTGLSSLSVNDARLSRSGREYETVDGSSAGTQRKQMTAVSRHDLSKVRTMLISAGVKGRAITVLAAEPRAALPKFVKDACITAGREPASLGEVSRRQEHVVAAKLLSDTLSKTLAAFEKSAIHFRAETCEGLNRRLTDLRDRASADLMPQVRAAGDDADAFVARLTTTHTLAIKQVNDSVDAMFRKRRQRLRFLQRAGFQILEWVVVGIMWWIWFFVSIIKVVRFVVVGGVRGTRWLLWL